MSIRGENAVRRILSVPSAEQLHIEVSWHALTDVGRRREVNQDSYVTSPPIFAVADGMGGHAAGEVASAAVVRRLAELGGIPKVTEEMITSALQDAVADMELDAGETDLGTGTTVTGLCLGVLADSPTWTVMNIGDSRVYQYFKGSLTQLTVDHSVVQHLLDTGSITADEAEVHPHANVITRAVGFNEEPAPDFTQLAVVAGQRLLVCSDGLTKELTDIGIQHFLASAVTAADAAEALIDRALENAGRDNITVIVIDVHAVGGTRDTSDIAALEASGGFVGSDSTPIQHEPQATDPIPVIDLSDQGDTRLPQRFEKSD